MKLTSLRCFAVKKDAQRIQSGQGGLSSGGCRASVLTPTPFIDTPPDRNEFVTVRDELDPRVGRFVRAYPGSLVGERWYLIDRSEGCPDSEKARSEGAKMVRSCQSSRRRGL
ncbi:hypothetical protein Bca52824_024200 [Brassica carinata]|uniref:Uncharacterized protein n=1 Tax=Brassica carinata TaxID=52824 RepID=A0A8X7VK65_BRACI|nr:hypothetical protein Bca52824_024200 [Brassica carinata]